MKETACRDMEIEGLSGTTVALYGTAVYEADAVTVMHGYLSRFRTADGLKLASYLLFKQVDEAEPPPEEVKPFVDLLGVASLLGVAPLECDSSFRYGADRPSRIQLPAPLLLGRPDDFYGFTHIETMSLSQRKGDSVMHSVEVSANDEHLLHEVNFKAEMTVTEENIRRLFDISNNLSKSLLYGGEPSQS